MIKITNWEQSKDLIKPIRYQVFVVEQNIPEAEEWDDDDFIAMHALAISNQEVIGTGRLIIDGAVAKIGRLSILKPRRAEGFGKAILRQLIETGKEKGVQEFTLHAQVHALEFYLREGFNPAGDFFDEVDIPHQRMVLRL
jgi:predicted GNAT family N-acyltransferase|uniref:GNAT family N-acetyltransferase n=1 Tax=Polynucleobacter sp. TaxID=2029855 RepID=UPI0040486E1B